MPAADRLLPKAALLRDGPGAAYDARYRTVQIRAGTHQRTAEDPAPADLHDALTKIHTIVVRLI